MQNCLHVILPTAVCIALLLASSNTATRELVVVHAQQSHIRHQGDTPLEYDLAIPTPGYSIYAERGEPLDPSMNFSCTVPAQPTPLGEYDEIRMRYGFRDSDEVYSGLNLYGPTFRWGPARPWCTGTLRTITSSARSNAYTMFLVSYGNINKTLCQQQYTGSSFQIEEQCKEAFRQSNPGWPQIVGIARTVGAGRNFSRRILTPGPDFFNFYIRDGSQNLFRLLSSTIETTIDTQYEITISVPSNRTIFSSGEEGFSVRWTMPPTATSLDFIAIRTGYFRQEWQPLAWVVYPVSWTTTLPSERVLHIQTGASAYQRGPVQVAIVSFGNLDPALCTIPNAGAVPDISNCSRLSPPRIVAISDRIIIVHPYLADMITFTKENVLWSLLVVFLLAGFGGTRLYRAGNRSHFLAWYCPRRSRSDVDVRENMRINVGRAVSEAGGGIAVDKPSMKDIMRATMCSHRKFTSLLTDAAGSEYAVFYAWMYRIALMCAVCGATAAAITIGQLFGGAFGDEPGTWYNPGTYDENSRDAHGVAVAVVVVLVGIFGIVFMVRDVKSDFWAVHHGGGAPADVKMKKKGGYLGGGGDADAVLAAANGVGDVDDGEERWTKSPVATDDVTDEENVGTALKTADGGAASPGDIKKSGSDVDYGIVPGILLVAGYGGYVSLFIMVFVFVWQSLFKEGSLYDGSKDYELIFVFQAFSTILSQSLGEFYFRHRQTLERTGKGGSLAMATLFCVHGFGILLSRNLLFHVSLSYTMSYAYQVQTFSRTQAAMSRISYGWIFAEILVSTALTGDWNFKRWYYMKCKDRTTTLTTWDSHAELLQMLYLASIALMVTPLAPWGLCVVAAAVMMRISLRTISLIRWNVMEKSVHHTAIVRGMAPLVMLIAVGSVWFMWVFRFSYKTAIFSDSSS